MNEYTLYEAFDKGHYIYLEYILKVHNYIAGNLISQSPNRLFWQAEYNYAAKLYHVCNWKKEGGMPPMAKKAEAICNNELVNFSKMRNIRGVFVQQFKSLIWGIDYAFLTKLNYVL